MLPTTSRSAWIPSIPAGVDTLFPSVPKSTQALKMRTIQGSIWAVGGRGSLITAQRMETFDSLGGGGMQPPVP